MLTRRDPERCGCCHLVLTERLRASGNPRQWCSDACRMYARRFPNHDGSVRVKADGTCASCGEAYIGKPWLGDCCSAGCATEAHGVPAVMRWRGRQARRAASKGAARVASKTAPPPTPTHSPHRHGGRDEGAHRGGAGL